MTDAYHESTEHDSNSSLNIFRESPKKYWEIRIAKTRQRDPLSPELEFGIAFHAMILQPDLIAKHYAVESNPDNKFFCVPSWGNKRKLSQSDLVHMSKMAWSIGQNSWAMKLLNYNHGKVEVPVYATDPETGVKLKCRPDLLTKEMIVPDIKTTAPKRKGKHPCSASEFSRTIYEYGYHRQAALYAHVIKLATGDTIRPILIPVSSGEPWGCAVYELSSDALAQGHEENMETLRDLAERRAKNNWEESFSNCIQEIDLPYWARRR